MSGQDGALSHRTLVFESFSVSVSEFYALVESLIRGRAIPGARISRVLLPEGGLLGAKREYLRVRRGRLEFLISASAFGESFMVTHCLRKVRRPWLKWIALSILVCSFLDTISETLYWAVVNLLSCFLVPLLALVVLYVLVRKLPGVSLVFRVVRAVVGGGWKILKLPTLYQVDTTTAFQSAVSAVIESAIQILRNGQGLRALPPGELHGKAPVAVEA